MHIVSECSKLAQTEYKKCHDKVAIMINWELFSKYGFESGMNTKRREWWKTRTRRSYRILTSKSPELQRLDAFILYLLIRRIRKRSSLMWLYLEIFVLGKRRLKGYRNPKTLRWRYLKCWIQKLVIPTVISALRAESLLSEYLALVGVMIRKSDSMQQTAMLESAHIMKKVLSILA